jgi:spermidine synthase
MAPDAAREIRERVSPSSGWFYRVRKTLYAGETAYQQIELVETEEIGRTLLLDGATQVMEANEFQYHEPMAHIPLLCHAKPERVLIIGGGDGGVLREVLKHPSVTQVDLVELDEAVISFSRTMLQFCSQGAFEDPRTRVHIQDGRSFVEQSKETYDIIIMDMTDPAGPSLRLYSREFFLALTRVLKDRQSRFIMHSESPDLRPQAFARIEAIEPDIKRGWYHVHLLLLQIPLTVVTWILRVAYINGETFTMEGKPIRLEKVVAPQGIDKPEKEPPSENGTGGNPKSKVISLKDLKKK